MHNCTGKDRGNKGTIPTSVELQVENYNWKRGQFSLYFLRGEEILTLSLTPPRSSSHQWEPKIREISQFWDSDLTHKG